MNLTDVIDDLAAEQAALDDVVAALDDDQWALPTPSPGWAITDQIGHLTYFDRTARLSIVDPDAFIAHRRDLMARFADPADVDDETLGGFRMLSPAERLAAWRSTRSALDAAGRGLADDARIEWYGPSMGAKSFFTARLMECWAHGQDVCDTVDAERTPTDRLRHIAQLGVITRRWSYAVRGEEPPDADVHVALTAPSGAEWTWGESTAPARITGPALDFCLVVTQRRHPDDTELDIVGEPAIDWMSKAQAFAGSPTSGPAPRTS